jgi:hypothetical protein
MELRHLRYFCAVADWNGFNRAARALHTSPSSISAQIRDLEREIGITLLNRTQSHVTLIEAGKRFLEESRKVLAAADRAVDIAQRTARGEIDLGNRRILSGNHPRLSSTPPRCATLGDGDQIRYGNVNHEGVEYWPEPDAGTKATGSRWLPSASATATQNRSPQPAPLALSQMRRSHVCGAKTDSR